MPITTGFNHIATLTTHMDRTVRFYADAFDAVVLYEVPASNDHPRMTVVDLGAGAALNIFETGTILGDRRQQGARGAIDHYGIAVDSPATLEHVRDRLVTAGAQEVGAIQQLGPGWSLFFRDPDGMELEVCSPPSDIESRPS